MCTSVFKGLAYRGITWPFLLYFFLLEFSSSGQGKKLLLLPLLFVPSVISGFVSKLDEFKTFFYLLGATCFIGLYFILFCDAHIIRKYMYGGEAERERNLSG